MDRDKGHLSWPDLMAVIDQASESAKQSQVHKHLAECQDCFQKWQEIKQMRVMLSTCDQAESPFTLDCLDEELIAAYLDQQLTEAEVNKLNRHIHTCDLCLSNLAHSFECHQKLMLKESNTPPIPSWLMEKAMALNSTAAKTPEVGWLTQTKRALKRVLSWTQESLLSHVPGYSLAGVFLILMLWQGFKVEPARLISFPESTRLLVFAEIPVAYRDGVEKWAMAPDNVNVLQQEPNFNGMLVENKEDWGLVFTWPKMEGTKEYNFTLFSRVAKHERVLVSFTTQEEIYAYSYAKYGPLDPDHVYEWVVSGKYGDGLHFKAKASFAVVK